MIKYRVVIFLFLHAMRLLLRMVVLAWQRDGGVTWAKNQPGLVIWQIQIGSNGSCLIRHDEVAFFRRPASRSALTRQITVHRRPRQVVNSQRNKKNKETKQDEYTEFKLFIHIVAELRRNINKSPKIIKMIKYELMDTAWRGCAPWSGRDKSRHNTWSEDRFCNQRATRVCWGRSVESPATTWPCNCATISGCQSRSTAAQHPTWVER